MFIDIIKVFIGARAGEVFSILSFIHFKATIEYVKANLISHYFLFDTDNISDEELSENAGNYIKHIFK